MYIFVRMRRFLLTLHMIDIFEGLYFSKKLNIKNVTIKTRTIKCLMEQEILSGTN